MLPLPPVPPEVGWRKSLRLPRDHYVRLDSNDYSVHPAVVGRRIEVHADLDRVWVTCEGAIVADHARVWAQHQTITDFEHAVAAKLLRHGRARPAAPGRRRGHRRGGRDPLTRLSTTESSASSTRSTVVEGRCLMATRTTTKTHRGRPGVMSPASWSS